MTNKNRFVFLILGAALLAACANKLPMLVTKSAVVPAGVDLSGSWSLRRDPNVRDRPPQEEGIRIGNERRPRSGLSSSRVKRGSKGMSAQVFIEHGENVKLTQTVFGLFISYDRSVVEEFTFGENRVVTIGPIEAQRASGWEDESFVAETRDDAGNILRETWTLQQMDILERSIHLLDGDMEVFTQQQIFDRK